MSTYAMSSPRCVTNFSAAAMNFSKRSSTRSEEHTSELQSRSDLVCRLLLEKKNNVRIDSFRDELFTDHILLRRDHEDRPLVAGSVHIIVSDNDANSRGIQLASSAML